MVRKGFGKEIEQDKLDTRFVGPFRAVKDNNAYNLYDIKDTFYKKCPPQELKFVKVININLLINLTKQKQVDESISSTRSRRDIDYHPNTQAFNYLDDEEDDRIDERSTNQTKKSELKLRKRKTKGTQSKNSEVNFIYTWIKLIFDWSMLQFECIFHKFFQFEMKDIVTLSGLNKRKTKHDKVQEQLFNQEITKNLLKDCYITMNFKKIN
jgi:hypothetical protein